MNPTERASELLEKYLSGICSPPEWEELLVLMSGMDESDPNALTQPLLKLWNESASQGLPTNSLDTEKLYQTIIAPEPRVRRMVWPWIAAAAAIFTGAIITVTLLRHAKPPISAITSPAEVKPGCAKAILTLAGGQQIRLDSTTQGTLAQQGNATLTDTNGSLVYRSTATSNPEIIYNTITTSPGGQYQLTLPDGTHVWLNAESSLRYPTSFNGADRNVAMTGEVYFEVAARPNQPFNVQVGKEAITVLGTAFNVNAYEDEPVLKTTLVNGSIRVGANNQAITLVPGEEATLLPQGSLTLAPGNIALATAWKNGYFQFDKAPIPTVMRQVGRWYNLEIRYSGPVPDRLFKGKVQKNLPLSGILEILQKEDIQFSLQGRVLTVKSQ